MGYSNPVHFKEEYSGLRDTGQYTVLLVDDNESSLELVKRKLESLTDFKVLTASSFDEAIEKACESDCVVSDYIMPDKDGLELMDAIQRRYDIPFILYTGKGSEELAEKAISRGVDDYITKKSGQGHFEILEKNIRKEIEKKDINQKYSDVIGSYKHLLDVAPIPVIITKDGKVVYGNQAAVEYSPHKDASEFIGDSIFDHVKDAESVKKNIEKLYKGDGPVTDVLNVQNGDEESTIRVQNALVDTGSGEAVLTFYQDISEIKRKADVLEQLYKANQQLMNSITKEEASAVAIKAAKENLGITISGVFIEDDGTLSLLECSEKSKEVVPNTSELEVDQGLISKAYRTGESKFYSDVSKEDEVLNKDTEIESEIIIPLGDQGVFVAGSTQKSLLEDKDLYFLELLGANLKSSFDQIDKRNQLELKQKKVEARNKKLENLSSIISHDLRNQLNLAQGYIDLANESENNADLEKSFKATKNIEKTLDKLLTAIKSPENLDKTKVNIEEVVKDVIQNMEDSDRLEYVFKEDIILDGDLIRLNSLIKNLISNSITHNSGKIRVEIGKIDNGFYYQDNGQGIPKTVKNNIFSKGSKVQDSEGHGLGLAIVKNIAENHGWTIKLADNEESRGARFEFHY